MWWVVWCGGLGGLVGLRLVRVKPGCGYSMCFKVDPSLAATSLQPRSKQSEILNCKSSPSEAVFDFGND